MNKFIRLKEHRDKLNTMLSRLSFNEKKYILKKVDERVIKSSNRLLEEKDKYVISEKAFRKIIWISTILSLILISLFLEAITTGKYILWGILSLIVGLIIFIIPIFLPVRDDIETLRKRAEKERTKAWRKGKVNHADEEE